MKKYLIICIVLACFLNLTVHSKEQQRKVTAKCFVNLYGGQQTIYYRTIKKKQLAKLAEKLTNKMIMTLRSNKKKKVFQVKECVLREDKFSGSQAREIEAKIAQ